LEAQGPRRAKVEVICPSQPGRGSGCACRSGGFVATRRVETPWNHARLVSSKRFTLALLYAFEASTVQNPRDGVYARYVLIHPHSDKDHSPNFGLRGFSEVHNGCVTAQFLASSCEQLRSQTCALCYKLFVHDKGKPVARRGRKAPGLFSKRRPGYRKEPIGHAAHLPSGLLRVRSKHPRGWDRRRIIRCHMLRARLGDQLHGLTADGSRLTCYRLVLRNESGLAHAAARASVRPENYEGGGLAGIRKEGGTRR